MVISFRAARIIASNVLIVVACIVFAAGFFPYKPLLPGLAAYPETQYGAPPPPQFDKIVFIVVDALRSDFVYSENSGFQFTQSLIRDGSAIPFTAHATAPTVTMPRIKAITTGSIPSFLDMILNFAESDTSSSLANQDTWLAQMKAKNSGKLTMFGDDTWLKLFPGMFDRADGTSSFFVSDFTEVDNNVTRHVPRELEKNDWNVMIMHYLGMDHIGHKSGPRSVNMIPKQREMDDIVSTVYHAMLRQSHLHSTLLVLCGDHGMNDGGNHGGSAPGETSPALTFISPKFRQISKRYPSPTEPSQDFDYYETIEQSDIAPTLATLLGFPIPRNNLGVLIPAFLSMWFSDNDKEQSMLFNGLQMLDIVKAAFPHPWYDDHNHPLQCSGDLSSRDKLACAWKNATTLLEDVEKYPNASVAAVQAFQTFCHEAQNLLSSTASNYNMEFLIGGILVAATATTLMVYDVISNAKREHVTTYSVFRILLVAYAVMMFASSYVEEEHHFWYWMTSGWITVLYASSQGTHPPTPHFLLLTLHRLTTHWSTSGQKHTSSPSITTFLTHHPSLLWPLILATFLNLGSTISGTTLEPLGVKKPLARAVGALMTTTGLIFKVAFAFADAPELVQVWGMEGAFGWCEGMDLLWAARAVFVGVGCCSGCVIVMRLTGRDGQIGGKRPLLITTLMPPITLLLLTQTRLTSTPLFLLSSLQLRLLRQLSSPTSQSPTHKTTSSPSPLNQSTHQSTPTPPPSLSLPSITLTTLLLSQTSFFASGGTNAISSIDLSQAYNGISSYSPVPVAVLLYLGNWAGAIWWGLAGLGLILENATRETGEDVRGQSILVDMKFIPTTTKERSTPPASPTLSSSSSSPSTTATAKMSQSRARHAAFTSHVTHLTLYTSLALTATMLACTVLRQHLFVWTVFSPKFLYAVAWAGLWHCFGGGVVGLFFTWAG